MYRHNLMPLGLVGPFRFLGTRESDDWPLSDELPLGPVFLEEQTPEMEQL